MQINSNNAASGQQALNGRQANATNKELDRDAFLKLLTTQMQAQDPLNPMDNTQFVSQLSQFTSLERLESMAQGMNSLAMSTSANTSAQMVSFIGNEVLLARDTVTLGEGGKHTPTEIELGGEASEIEVTVKDSTGKIVRTVTLGTREAGKSSFEWDGLGDDGAPLPPGEYSFKVSATNEEDESVPAQVLTRRKVSGVRFEGGIPRLELEGLEKSASLGEIEQVTRP